MTELKAKKGLWTPWALVLCYECHGFTFDRTVASAEGGFKTVKHTISEFEQKRVMKELPLEENEAITFCDKCGTSIRTYDSVAHEHNLVKTLRDFGINATMAQTGGMNSACSIYREWPEPIAENVSEPEYLIVYDWDGDKTWDIGRYGPDAEWDEGFGYSTKSLDELVKYILELDDTVKLTEEDKQ